MFDSLTSGISKQTMIRLLHLSHMPISAKKNADVKFSLRKIQLKVVLTQ